MGKFCAVYLHLMEQRPMSVRTHEDMRDVLMDPDATGPEVHYTMLRGGEENGNITAWKPGRVGEEYIKTFGHYHTWDFPETYRIMSGEGIALMQKRALVDGKPADDSIEDFRVIKVKAGDTLEVPIGYGHILANTGEDALVTTDNSPSNDPTRPHADYEPIRRMHGFAYYLVERDGAPALIKNPRYRLIGTTDFAGIPVIE
jgi:oxalate decarboxylase/phosphoglucose isomerase-like protein (cupin superfamily)